MKDEFSVLILAAGLSGRMGSPKAMLLWDEKRSFLEKIIDTYIQAGCSDVVVVINKETENFCRELKVPSKVSFVVNEHPQRGRIYSVRLGLGKMPDGRFCFIQNVDNPFVTAEIIGTLMKSRMDGAWCSPVFHGHGGHPVLLSFTVIEKILDETRSNLSLHDILETLPRIAVDAGSDAVLRNINTPGEYSRYFGKGSQ